MKQSGNSSVGIVMVYGLEARIHRIVFNLTKHRDNFLPNKFGHLVIFLTSVRGRAGSGSNLGWDTDYTC
jgi:hypothetical protein